VHRVPEHPVPPGDVDELAALLEGFVPPEGEAPEVPTAERHEGAWQLTVPLPFAERSTLRLTRWIDDLVVSVGDARRSIRLDALLRRCEVTGGRLVDPGTPDARLVVGFRPDPQQWPADLLAVEGRTP
jgi:arsenite-transporting ATPase